MKKIKIILISALMLTLAINIFYPLKSVSAETLEVNNKNYSVVLSGYGEYQLKADTAKIKVATIATEDTSNLALESANSKMQEILNILSSNSYEISSCDCIEFMKPKFHKSKIIYEYSKICTLETNNIDEIDNITSLLKENDAIIIDVEYTSQDLTKAYSNAIKNALSNAENIANGINPNLKLKRVMEEKIFSKQNCRYNLDGTIFIDAKVLAHFECEDCENIAKTEIDDNLKEEYSSSLKNKNIIPF